ncbi:MAG: 4-hydroxy-tetrahydrodipicolinate reductase [Thermoanaerobacteraceae bacterium]|nr:4-hydroxy-tetrahydrodipicolinate reductase [Thermoanaerobacteraceae bacterium]
MAVKVVVAGAMGKMGRAMMKALHNADDVHLVGAVDVNDGASVAELIGSNVNLFVEKDLEDTLRKTTADVLVDFTRADAAVENGVTAIENGVCPVIGTTGLKEKDVERLYVMCEERRLGGVIAPNFALGAILMMRFATEAARYFSDVEIIELHHAGKQDAPSGTALTTAKSISTNLHRDFSQVPETYEKAPGARGAEVNGIPIHSVRLPGLVAHQEVIFGGTGESLTIRHDSYSRESFQAGVLLAVKKVVSLDRMVIGLENLL